MPDQEEFRVCPRCGENKLLTVDNFYWRRLGRVGWEMPCKVCRSALKRIQRGSKAQFLPRDVDWASFYHRTLLPAQMRVFQDPTLKVSAWDLRVQLHSQKGRCPYLGRPFVMPSPDDMLQGGWAQWRYTLYPYDALHTPILVRGDLHGRMEPGNLLLISACLEEMYLAHGGIHGFYTFMQELSELEPPALLSLEERSRIFAELSAAGPKVEEPSDE